MRFTLRFLSAVDVCFVLAFVAPPVLADMPHNDMPHNSISLEGLSRAAPLLDALANGPLDDATITAAIAGHPSLLDPGVAALLDKIVSCAVDKGTTLSPFPVPVLLPVPAPTTELAGELGLCGSRSAFGNWHTSALSGKARRSCEEAVTACVLARVNAVGHRIVISVRTLANLPISLQSSVPIETQYRTQEPINSFAACSASSTTDCGYDRQFVGRCVAGTPMHVAADAGTGIRICQGIYGCDSSRSESYTKVLAEGVALVPFTCPQNGPTIATEAWGYYGVMTRPASPGAVTSVHADSGRYPASEKSVFTWPEGAFYGNIFRTDLTARAVAPGLRAQVAESGLAGTVAQRYEETDGPSLAGDQNACFSPVWDDGVARMDDRFCAKTGDCFANKPMACYRAQSDRCAKNALASLAFARCQPTMRPTGAPRSSENVWDLVITTYLNNPCDLARDKCNPREVVHGQPPDPGPDDYGKPTRAAAK